MCTHLTLAPQGTISNDNPRLSGRCHDFPFVIPTTLQLVPKQADLFADGPRASTGQRYGFASVRASDNLNDYPVTPAMKLALEGKFKTLAQNTFYDGLNEAGLSGSALYMVGSRYEAVSDTRAGVPYNQLVGFVLRHYASVDEIERDFGPDGPLAVVNPLPGVLEQILPLHMAFTDQAGNALIIECLNGETQLYRNHHGVMTNQPSYPWQLNNLNHYTHLSCTNVVKFDPQGQAYQANGSGLQGLPADATPESRFVRAFKMRQAGASINPDEPAHLNYQLRIMQMFKVLQTMWVPMGSVLENTSLGRDAAPVDKLLLNPPQNLNDFSQFCTIRDHQNCYFYFSTYSNPGLNRLDLPHRFAGISDIETLELFPTEPWYTEV
ncbi:Penicillin V acylase, Ntn superfamily [Ferrimonas sediminum]|uniref:Penicillin V acylase, Ntn superfamily n=1 Tax=Ferrimonas sediminum TaxID=718193 RepID=A0A1G8JWS2_9GAMM|nr:linear amide C-N hydrolase [Ferrimonas sediminum]SDI35575.1 Penicillin V acylase, Ntn superfamily [Ferrimonas sediminum]